jgi:hypothetical protein
MLNLVLDGLNYWLVHKRNIHQLIVCPVVRFCADPFRLLTFASISNDVVFHLFSQSNMKAVVALCIIVWCSIIVLSMAQPFGRPHWNGTCTYPTLSMIALCE